MTNPKVALERIRDHSVGIIENGPCAECEHMIEWAKAAIPVAELYEQAMELFLTPSETEIEWWSKIEILRTQLKALK